MLQITNEMKLSASFLPPGASHLRGPCKRAARAPCDPTAQPQLEPALGTCSALGDAAAPVSGTGAGRGAGTGPGTITAPLWVPLSPIPVWVLQACVYPWV